MLDLTPEQQTSSSLGRDRLIRVRPHGLDPVPQQQRAAALELGSQARDVPGIVHARGRGRDLPAEEVPVQLLHGAVHRRLEEGVDLRCRHAGGSRGGGGGGVRHSSYPMSYSKPLQVLDVSSARWKRERGVELLSAKIPGYL